jgi:transposase InsO family protein
VSVSLPHSGRTLTVVDAFTREALAIEVDQGIKGEQVVAVVGRLALLRGAPGAIRVDNGPEPKARVARLESPRPLGLRERRHVGLLALGKPTDNVLVESFNGRLRDACLVGRREEQDRDVAAALQREPTSRRPGVADAPGIRLGGGPAGRRMRSGGSPFGLTKIRGTLNEEDTAILRS